MSGPIVITVPTKYIPVNLAPAPVKLEIMPSPSTNGSDAEESTSSIDEYLVRGKKRRLDHLTWEEKLQRKKLKNRVAAQTSRDRKKAKMEDMELTIQQQTDQINQLQEKCESLQLEKDAIYSKYLDLESRFEDLQHQFEEQRKQQQTAIGPITIKSEPDLTGILHSVGCVSTLTGSAASAYFPLQQGSKNGNTNDSASESEVGRQRQGSLTLEDHCSLPALQDILEEFDVSKLEELAESLLANVSSELEVTDRGSSQANAEDAGTGSRVLRPMVGTSSEQLESCKETNQGSSLILTTHNYSKSPFHKEKLKIEHSQQSDLDQQSTTLYGTYDDATNCITIILNKDDMPLEEEIVCEEAEQNLIDEQEFSMKLEPIQELLSPSPSPDSDNSLSAYNDTKPVLMEDAIPFKCPLTPGSFVSDGGYESLGSPISTTDYGISTLDEFWNLDLFPILN
ncbi:LOW QUALITY PROTEIN: uncharacterized protein LOC131436487 [Malaya genurostris]|uniref:LOW QUALITY PROTEIN: uncharacterized protein LOC131436487 n=1 Tax=Malaya genurostris TaxID=325434 RepID=UPI0026F38227|nr:LOW QUALITY PROTEIN: uncharacterized protein LOC131436487 [Malaya genurostris]